MFIETMGHGNPFNNMKKLNILILACLILIPISYGANIYTEGFDYTDKYSDRGWSYIDGACTTCSETPIDSPFQDTAFGINGTADAGTNMQIERSITLTNTSILTIEFSVYTFNHTNKPLTVSLYDSGLTQQQAFRMLANGSFDTTESPASAEHENCIHTQVYDTEFPDISYHQIEINYDTGVYTWYINGVSTGCALKGWDTTIPFEYLVVSIELSGAFSRDSSIIDNIIIDHGGETLDVPQVGLYYPCEGNADCVSGKCEYGQCVLGGRDDPCDTGSQCISQTCVNGVCTKPSSAQLLDQAKNENFGDDALTANLICIILIAFVIGIIIFFGRSVLSAMLGFFVGVVLSFFFALLGWLSAWIILGEVIVLLVIFILLVMLRTSSS